MKAIILAGGFAKRLWPLTREIAKPLIEVNNKPIISYIVEELEKADEIDEIIVSTNAKFSASFEKWAEKQNTNKRLTIIVENTNNENEKLGAIGGVYFSLNKLGIDGDVLVIGGDNFTGIEIEKMIKVYRRSGCTVNAVYDIKNIGIMTRYGEVVVDKEGKIIRFREKPEKPETTLLSACCYIFPSGIKEKIRQYFNEGGNKDAIGFFTEWLIKNSEVRAYMFDNFWFDIGSKESLNAARKYAVENF